MKTDTIFRLLKNAGFQVLGADGAYIHLEDPSCILKSFEIFLNYAWIAITFITVILLFGWAIAYIRGSKAGSLFANLRNLTLIFGIMATVKPAVNLIWGGDVFARGCKTIKVSIDEVQKILAARNLKLKERNENDLYEEFDIYDSGAIAAPGLPNELPYGIAPVYSAGDAKQIFVEVYGGAPMYPMQPGTSISSASGARESENEIIYTKPNGERYKKTGGTRAWRNNNPGNIIDGKFARSHGAIGVGGRFAIFPDETTGMAAIAALLRTESYNRLTVAGAISRYAPPHENNTTAYHKRLQQLTGISINTPMNQLTDTQLGHVANAIREIEGWDAGREVKLQHKA
ncbi:MAG: hypothetical protein LBF28_02790 [Rickettsiales bacterium]|jgi:hypothetical protein|nr:hypothetical protein [Rickettsiales bacterium]